MAQAATLPTAVTPAAPAIDRDRLRQMTFGDRSLERELLRLFDRQAEMLLSRMQASEPAVLAALAHTLKGSAVGVGAGAVARAAEFTERAADRPLAERAAALRDLAAAIAAARGEIAALLAA
jgi:HPt (histidine-containing phosphotransfer) domain-containing protein